MSNTRTKADIIRLLDELDRYQTAEDYFTIAAVDLLVSLCYYILGIWGKLQPRSNPIGILLLAIEMQCLQLLEKEKLLALNTFTKKEGTP